MSDVDFVNGLLPNHLRIEWIHKYHDMSQTEKIQPFKPFTKFLEREREAVVRSAEYKSRWRKIPKITKVWEQGKGLTWNRSWQGQACFTPAHSTRKAPLNIQQLTVKNFKSYPSVERVASLSFSNK